MIGSIAGGWPPPLPPPPSDRSSRGLANATWAYLDELSKLGTHGTTAPGVAATLIENGIREAIDKGYLKFERRDEERLVFESAAPSDGIKKGRIRATLPEKFVRNEIPPPAIAKLQLSAPFWDSVEARCSGPKENGPGGLVDRGRYPRNSWGLQGHEQPRLASPERFHSKILDTG
jgi:hypothetical protein